MQANSVRHHWSLLATSMLVGLSVLATETALTPAGRTWPWDRMVDGLLALPFLALIAWAVRQHQHQTLQKKPPVLAVGLLVCAFVLPLIYYGLFALIRRQGFLLEVVLLSCLRNLAIGTALLAQWKIGLRMSALCSLFLVVFSAVIADGPWLHMLLGLYSACGCVWLLLNYWSLIPMSAEGRFPVFSVLLIASLIGISVVVGLVGPAKAAQALAGFLPSSGGTHDYDPDSRGGTNDGEDTVRGSQESRSTGFTDSEFFLDSPDDSLYDVTHDLYGDAIKPKNWERAIALPAEKMIKKELIPAENLQASREFSLLRHPPKPSDEPLESHGASALAYVQGRAPAHLPVTAYDHFDGIIWSEAGKKTIAIDLINESQTPWMQLREKSVASLFASTDRHIIKVAKFKTASLPMPGHMTRFRVGKINQTNFFAWAQEGIVRLADRNIPKGTIVEAETQTIDYPTLSQRELDWSDSVVHRQYLSQPVNDLLEQRLRKLAHEWGGDQPRGWKQVEAIVQGVRNHGILDKSYTPPPECRDVVGHFLDAKRGRDVDFATTAVLLLRTLGYPTRLVSGLYVHPDHYDVKTEHYMVYRDDVHFWPEILLEHKAWVALEPTPGYSLATPVYSWWMRVATWVTTLWQAIVDHPWFVGIALVFISLLCWARHLVLDKILTWCWRLGRRQTPRQEVLRTVRLIDRRAIWAGQPRPHSKTPESWYCTRCQSHSCNHAIQQLMQMSAWAAYAPASQDDAMPWKPEAVYSICDQVVQHWNLRQFRRTVTSSLTTMTI